MARIPQYFSKLARRIRHSIGVCFGFHFLKTQARFAQRRGRCTVYIFPYDRKCAPHGKSLERKNDLNTRFFLHALYQRQILAETCFIEHKTGRRDFFNIHL